jgi:NAD(P)-dependent dehydrogenase (short-subunit alcohol dehydrogenase family)
MSRFLVSGADGALGSVVTEQLLSLGHEVEAPLYASTGSWALEDRVAVRRGVDLTDPEATKAAVGEGPRLGGIVLLAGGYHWGPMSETTPAHLDRLWKMNVLTAYYSLQAAVDRVEAGGSVVLVTADTLFNPRANDVAYAMTKAAVAALTEGLAKEKPELFVNAVAPTILDTPVNRSAMPDADTSRWIPLARAAGTIAQLATAPTRTGGIIPL